MVRTKRDFWRHLVQSSFDRSPMPKSLTKDVKPGPSSAIVILTRCPDLATVCLSPGVESLLVPESTLAGAWDQVKQLNHAGRQPFPTPFALPDCTNFIPNTVSNSENTGWISYSSSSQETLSRRDSFPRSNCVCVCVGVCVCKHAPACAFLSHLVMSILVAFFFFMQIYPGEKSLRSWHAQYLLWVITWSVFLEKCSPQ